MIEQPIPTATNHLQENFEDFFDSSLCGFIIADTKGFILRANEKVAAWIECNTDELKGKRFSDLLAVGGKIYYETHLSPLLRMQGFFDEVVLEISSTTGRKLRVMVNADERRDKDGKPCFIRFTLLKATDRLQYEQNLQDANAEMNKRLLAQNAILEKQNEELQSFTFVASHDLKEPLRKIEMFTSRISQTEAQNFSEKSKEYFNSILTSTKRMQNLIDAVLSYAKANTLHHLKPTDLNETLKQATETLDERIVERGAVINSSNLPTIQAIPEQMEQLFTNLLSNALKYSKSETAPVITITANEVNGKTADTKENITFWRIDFTDNGIGFDEKQKHKIFEIFQRLHTKTEYSGTGIGLAICKKIAENHKGDMSVTSIIGEGSTFSVLIPQAQL